MSHQQQVSNTPKLPQIEPDPLPPDVKVIECPASVADYRSSDNSKWTNILKESITIQKGSEIRVSTNFIDQRGIDPDIIQFTSSGNQQDNSHTLLSQVYTTNDGYNGKTTSYDYMSRAGFDGLRVEDPGQDVGGTGFQASFTAVTGIGVGLEANVSIGAYCIRPSNITITDGGSNYINGSTFTIASGGDAFNGRIVVNDVGSVVRLIMNKPYSANNPPDPNAVVVANNTLGTGLTVDITITQNGYYFSSFVGTRTDATRGTFFNRGDLVTITENSATTAIPSYNQPSFMVRQVYLGEGQCIDESMFDQGYNYEKVPLYRWSQVYDVNQNFSYGNNLGARSFETSYGKNISITTPSNYQDFDTCISSSTMIMPREDEFAPGIFHKEFPELVDNTVGTQAQIALFNPILNLKKTPNTGGAFTWSWYDAGPLLTVEDYDYVQNGTTVKSNVLNAYPPGCPLRIFFKAADDSVTTATTCEIQAAGATYTAGSKATTGGSGRGLILDILVDGGGGITDVLISNAGTGYRPGDIVIPEGGDGNARILISYEFLTALDAEWNNVVGGLYVVNSVYRSSTTTMSMKLSPYSIDYVGEGTLFEAKVGANIYPPSASTKVQLVYDTDSDDLGAPTRAPEIYINTNAGGIITSINATEPDLDLGEGNRTSMIYTIQGYASTDRIICLKTDNTNGFYGARGIKTFENADLTYDSGTRDAEMFIVPINNYVLKDDSTEEAGDRRGFRYSTDPPTLGTDLPASIYDQGINTTLPTDDTIGVTSYVSNGLYRPAGHTDSTSSSFNPALASLINHNVNTQLNVRSYSNSLPDISLSYGTTGVVRPANPGTSTFDNGAGGLVLVINIEEWQALGSQYNIDTLPLYTTIEIIPSTTGAPDTGSTVQMETGGFESFDDTNYYILIKTPDVHNNDFTYFPIEASNQAAMGRTFFKASIGVTAIQNYEGTPTDGVDLAYTLPLYYNNQIKFWWIDSDTTNLNNGPIASTGPQNYFNTNDVNYDTATSISTYTSESVRSSYNQGGYYFLTAFTGHLTTADNGNAYQYNNSGINVFNNWGVFMPFAQLPPAHYAWRNGKTDPWTGEVLAYTQSNENYNSNTAYTDASNHYAYQPLYKQKAITINKNFCVASDISGIWTRSAHALTGAVDLTSGDEYTPANQNPLLQNEFIFPVYGSNNVVGVDGQYELDSVAYPYSSGLEPGHVVGKAYLTGDNEWLAAPLISTLPTDVNDSRNFSFFYVFFRTPWTFVRAYDPLASSGGAPVFTPLTTVNQTADKIGNANDSKATPPVSGRTALDGTTMLDAGATPVPVGYELGSPGGDATAVTFGTQQYYPIYYLDERNKAVAPKAKASQYVGSQNLTLAFATDISAFTFQYFHTPYTSPFVDGQGGTESIRVFYGNRKRGIFNHETLGGINIINYCRPEYPRGIFTYNEVNESTFTQYPNGLNPLTSVAPVGQRFLNKVGFTDSDVGIVNGQVSSTLAKTGYSYTPLEVDITAGMDTGAGDTSYWAYTTTFNATTGSGIDSSDSILAEIPAPETIAGLESNNSKITPNIGANNYILRKWGDVIFYPYSLNTSSNSFQDKAIVRFDNASSSYGTIGGLLLSNSNRGMGLPNTVGSTFNTDDDTIPRTLNPDCELYLAYTIATQSNFIQASLLPAKLPNGYILVISSLQKQTPFYMAEAGFVNAVSVVNKTFLTGDFILSEGQLSFYTQEDMILSEITTELRDTNFNAPTVLGPNSTVVYQITNYNPTPPKPLPTIEEEQEQDYAIMAMIQEHLDYLEGHSKSSPLSELESNLREAGMSILQGGSSMADVVQAMKNQIEFHDLPNLSQGELSQFLSTPEGKDMQANIADMAVVNQQVGQIAQNREDIAIQQAAQPPGSRAVEHLERQNEQSILEIKRRTEEIRKRIPQNFFTPSLPPEQQMEPLPGNQPLTINQLNMDDFKAESEKRYSLYLEYREDRIIEGRPPLTYEEFQHFHYGDILDLKNEQQRNIVRDTDPDLMPNIHTRDIPSYNEAMFPPGSLRRHPLDPTDRSQNVAPEYQETTPGEDIIIRSGPSRKYAYYINPDERVNRLEEPEAVKQLSQLRNPLSGYAAAYEALPDYMRPRHNEPGYFENLEKFKQEIEAGTAELTGNQIDILRESGINYQPSVAVKASQGKDVPIMRDIPPRHNPKERKELEEKGATMSRAPSKHYLSRADLPELAHLPDLAIRPFRSTEDREAVKNLIASEYRTKIGETFKTRRGAPSKAILKEREALRKEINKRIEQEGITHHHPSVTLPSKLRTYSKSKTIPIDPEYTGYRDPNIRKAGYERTLQEKKVRDEAVSRIKEHQKRMRPTGEQIKQNREDLRSVRQQRETDVKRTFLKHRLNEEKKK